jgi:hypothetical protein
MQRGETYRFEAISDDGKKCIIVEYTRMLERMPLSGGIQRIPTSREYLTDFGLHMNAIEDSIFEEF